jgi:hypothetical protein
MARRTAEAISGALFRARQGRPPSPPKDMDGISAQVWRRIASARPADWFDQASELLLSRLCRTIVYAERAHDKLDAAEPGTPAAAQLLKEVAVANSSIVAMMTKLRLTVQGTISWDETGRKSERGTATDPLLGGLAIQGWQQSDIRN